MNQILQEKNCTFYSEASSPQRSWYLISDPLSDLQTRATTISEDEAADIQYDTSWESLGLDFLSHFLPCIWRALCAHAGEHEEGWETASESLENALCLYLSFPSSFVN